jgi:iron complex outermembrane receptor protein
LCLGSPLDADAQDNEEIIEEVIVRGSLRSLPTEDVGSVFGFDKNLLEVPRSASSISFEQMERFDMRDIDELIALAPSTFTQSFFGIAGALDIRGTAGEVYFRGIRRLDNPGNFPTPIGASDRIDIVRGPASPIMGPAKIGGYLNFVPKSARVRGGAYLEEPAGRVSYSTGSWSRDILTAEVGGPGSFGGRQFGYYLYGEIEDSGSYYDNSGTDQTLLQASFEVDMTDATVLEFGTMYHDYDGNQIAGWNRLTQDLIDNGTYITGRPPALDTDGDELISHQEFLAADGGPDGNGTSLLFPFVFRPEFVTVDNLVPSMALEDPGTATLDGSRVLVAADDVLQNEDLVLYFDVIHDTSGGWEFKNQLYFEQYENLNENIYGFSQFHDSWVIENKLVLSRLFEGDTVKTSMLLSPSIRHTDFEHAIDFENEYFDRRDLTGPSTPRDRRLLSTRIGRDYTNYFIGDYTMLGLAGLVDMAFDNGLGLMLGMRWDSVDVTTTSREGLTLRRPSDAPDVISTDTDGGLSWTASLTWATDVGLIPYVTASEQSTVIAGQGAEISSSLIDMRAWYDQSDLFEAGVKGSFLDDTLYFALAGYQQTRTDFLAQAIVTNQSNETEGWEFEARWVVNENLLLTTTWSEIDIVNLDTIQNGGRFSYFGAEDIPQIDPVLVYGGAVTGIPAAPTRDDARRAGIPETIRTLTATYAFDNGLAVNASIIDVDATPSSFSRAVTLPAYTLVNAGVIYEAESWSLSMSAKNLTDERYFRANFPNLYGAQIVLPELPFHWAARFSWFWD